MVKKIVNFSMKHPKIMLLFVGLMVLFALSRFPQISVDTDPENMLSANSPARIFHQAMKKEFALYDLVVLGVINDQHPEGVFNVDTLGKVYEITEKIKKVDGVIAYEMVALSTKDNIEQDGIGAVRFNWLMDKAPQTQEEVLRIRSEAQDHPMFENSVVSKNGKALIIYVPIKQKDISYEVAQSIRSILAEYKGDEEYHITGLPVANDQFGVEMFKQMAVSAPMAGLIIFLLMWFFFKSLSLIVAPMLVAIATVLMTMGLLIGFGFPVHIMSSMIPIFLMPIAVLDSVHILSEFFDKYQIYKDRKKTMSVALEELFSPMLFTSLTSAVGFYSLSFSPIPPVQVFGVFVGTGILIAWVLTLTLIPAYVMLLKDKTFEGFGAKHGDNDKPHVIDKLLCALRGFVLKRHKAILIFTVFLVLVSLIGIARIRVNDNPVRWFNKNHSIRVADRILNEHFSGTYEAYLVLDAEDKGEEVFKSPTMLKYMERLQADMIDSSLVGKATSLTDIVKKVYYELLGGDKVNNVVPETRSAVAQCLISFENSHKPDDLWHMTTPDFSKATIWLQIKSGDNKDMSKVMEHVAKFIKMNPPPFKVKVDWAGLSYINVIWQNNMVGGMLKNFLGSFVIVLFMMLFLFRSPVKALISMIPLSVTILFIYSLLGFFGKDYDMPVAVLSALTLGLSVDFAIHFIQRAIEIYQEKGDWESTSKVMFAGPSRAIVRNALVVAIGFLPLLVAPLVPYKTVGFFMFAIMAVSSLATLFVLPSIISWIPNTFFVKQEKGCSCSRSNCVMVGLFIALAVCYVLFGFTSLGWKLISFIVIVLSVIFSFSCHFISKRKACLTQEEK